MTYADHRLDHIYVVHLLNTLGVEGHDDFFRREIYYVGLCPKLNDL